MLFIGYLVVVLTVLSISAIATSATVEGGGVYCILIINGMWCGTCASPSNALL